MGFFRSFFILLDKVVFNSIDTAYNLIFSIAGTTLNSDVVKDVIKNLYIVVGLFAFFKIAVLLINSLIDPEKLSEKGKGLGNILVRTVIMIILLMFTPMLFDMAYDLQGDIIGKAGDPDSGHIIEKLILGESAIGDTSEGSTPGDKFKSTALTALIPVSKEFVDGNLQVPSEKNNWTGGYVSKCNTSECVSAIKQWNEMYVNNKMDIDKLANYISTYEKVDVKTSDGQTEKEKVYVYDYNIILTTIVGGFIAYVLFSFSIDIAIRVFQLAALEIVSPLFIVTFIDPKSASSGMFNRWLKEVGSTYANLFIRIACVSLLLLFTSVINTLSFVELGDNSVWVKLVLLLGLLIFAKKAPKWISDLIGIKSDGAGLWTPRKLKENMLGGAMMAGAAKGLIGSGFAGAKNLASLARDRRARKKALKDSIMPAVKEDERKRRIAKKMADLKRSNPGMTSMQAKPLAERLVDQKLKAEREAAKKAYNDAKKDKANRLDFASSAARIGSALVNAGGAFKSTAKADNLSGSLKLANDRASAFKKDRALEGDTAFDKVKTAANNLGLKISDRGFGDESAVFERSQKLAKEKARKLNHTKEALDKYGDDLYDGMGSFSQKIQTSDGVTAKNIEDAKAIYGAKLSGISDISYDASGNLTINGSANVSGYVDIAQASLSGHGKVDFLDKFNKTQDSSLNEFQDNLQQQQNIAQSIAPLKEMLNQTVKNMKDAFSSIDLGTLDGKISIEANGALQIKGQDFNSKELLEKLEEWKNAPASSDEKLLYDFFVNNQGSQILNSLGQCDAYSSTITMQEDNIQKFADRNEQLKRVVEGVQDKVDVETGLLDRNPDGTIKKDARATTIAGALNVVAQTRDTISKKLAAADKQAEKEGKK